MSGLTQRNRPAAKRGTVYLPAAAEDFTLTVKTARGERTPAATDHVQFIESRGFMAVSAIIPETELLKLGGLDAAIRVRNAASLLPAPVAGEPDPLTEKEIAYVTKWRRAQATEIVDDRPEAKAVKLLAGLTNRLPGTGAVRPAVLDDLWQQAIGDEVPAAGDASNTATTTSSVTSISTIGTPNPEADRAAA